MKESISGSFLSRGDVCIAGRGVLGEQEKAGNQVVSLTQCQLQLTSHQQKQLGLPEPKSFSSSTPRVSKWSSHTAAPTNWGPPQVLSCSREKDVTEVRAGALIVFGKAR